MASWDLLFSGAQSDPAQPWEVMGTHGRGVTETQVALAGTLQGPAASTGGLLRPFTACLIWGFEGLAALTPGWSSVESWGLHMPWPRVISLWRAGDRTCPGPGSFLCVYWLNEPFAFCLFV